MAAPISRYWVGPLADLPNPEATVEGSLWIITDAAYPGDTTVGGGSNVTYARYNGSQWVSTQDSELTVCLVVNQDAHGFTVGQVLSAPPGEAFRLADASVLVARADLNRARALGVVIRVLNVNSFVLQVAGLTDVLPAGQRGLLYYLDPATPGAIREGVPYHIGEAIVPVATYLSPSLARLDLGARIHPVLEEAMVVTAPLASVSLALPGDRNMLLTITVGVLASASGQFGVRINNLSGVEYDRRWITHDGTNVKVQTETTTQWTIGWGSAGEWAAGVFDVISYEYTPFVAGSFRAYQRMGQTEIPIEETGTVRHLGAGGVDSVQLVEVGGQAFIDTTSYLKVAIESPARVLQSVPPGQGDESKGQPF